MKKILAIILSVSYLSACSFLAGGKQNVTVMTNVPTAEIYANGEVVGHGTSAKFRTKRNENLEIMAKADGYRPAYKSIDTKLSAVGILDLAGFFVFLLPIFGLLAPGSKTLTDTNISVELVPANAPLAAAETETEQE